MNTYFIGDVHGCNRTLQALLQRLSLGTGDRLIFLGDLIDRGPDSKGVVKTVWQLQQDGIQVVCLRGNHEQLLLDTYRNPHLLDLWSLNGGRQTLDSFGISSIEQLDLEYVNFFQAMPLWYEVPGYIAVHAGLNFSAPNPLDDHRALLWLRHWYEQIDYQWLGNRIIIHGHTPASLAIIEHQCEHLTQYKYLNLDNGCVYACVSPQAGLGNLLAFQIDTRELFVQPFVG